MSHFSKNVIPVNDLNFEAEVLKSPIPVMVDVGAEWCPPCRAAEPIVDDIARNKSGKIKVVYIDGGESPDLVAKLGVRGFPTFLGVVRGSVVCRRAGFSGRRALEAMSDEIGGMLEAR